MSLSIRSRVCDDLRGVLLACLWCPLSRSAASPSDQASSKPTKPLLTHLVVGRLCSRSASPKIFFLVVRAFLLQVTGAYAKMNLLKEFRSVSQKGRASCGPLLGVNWNQRPEQEPGFWIPLSSHCFLQVGFIHFSLQAGHLCYHPPAENMAISSS